MSVPAMTFDGMVRALVNQGVPEDKARRAAADYAEPPPKRKTPRVNAGQKAFDFAALKFKLLCKESGLPLPVTEHYFAKHIRRNWRFDFAWSDEQVALEVEGGLYSGGRHVRGKGYENDMEKYTQANLMGWRLVRVSPRQLCTESTIRLVRTAMELGGDRG